MEERKFDPKYFETPLFLYKVHLDNLYCDCLLCFMRESFLELHFTRPFPVFELPPIKEF